VNFARELLFAVEKLYVDFMNQGSGLQCMVQSLRTQVPDRNAPQFAVQRSH
jgi:hypothetical protein